MNNDNVGGDKKPKWKVKFPCKLCEQNHLTQLCPRMDEALKLIAQSPVVLTNLIPHNQNMASSASTIENGSSGSQNPSSRDVGHACINML